jgi:hypothetical protein
MAKSRPVPAFVFAVLACTVLSASAFVGRAPSRPLAFATTSANPMRHSSLLSRAYMAVETELEKKIEEQTKQTENNGEVSKEVVLAQEDLELPKEEEEMSKTQKMMQQVKDAGVAGIISFASWEFLFWFISVPVCIFGYVQVTGHMPDFSNGEDMSKLGAEAFAFVNFARFAVPLRIGLALSTTPWIQENIVDRFMKKEGQMEKPTVNGKRDPDPVQDEDPRKSIPPAQTYDEYIESRNQQQ